MSNAARTGRRRRFLHEGSAESSSRSSSQSQSKDADTSDVASGDRYAHRSDSASFAIAKRLLPLTWGNLTLTMLGLVTTLSVLVAAAAYSSQYLPTGSWVSAELFALGVPATLSAWFASSLWLAIAAVSFVLFGVRRQRMDDLRCHYRWWLVAATTALAMSLNTSIGGHQFFANGMAQLVGWSPLPMNAFWWLLPATLVVGGIAIRMLFDLAESRWAQVTSIMAMLTIFCGWSVEAGLVPNSVANVSPLLLSSLVGPAVTLMGTTLLLVATMLYSRHIVLEEGGLIAKPAAKVVAAKSSATPEQPTASSKSKNSKKETPREATSAVAEKSTQRTNTEAKPSLATEPVAQPEKSARSRAEQRAEEKRQRKAAAQASSEPTLWVSGEDSNYEDEYEESGAPRKLSKAERKRLRKQKARHAA